MGLEDAALLCDAPVACPGDVRVSQTALHQSLLPGLGEGVSWGRMIQEVILRGLGMSARTGSAVPTPRAARCSQTTWRPPR